MCHDGLNESGYSRHSIRLIDHPCIMTPLQELKHELRCWFLFFFSDWAAEVRAWASREEEMKPIFVVKLFAFDHSVQFIFQCFAFIPFCWIRWWYFWFVDISWNKDLILISFNQILNYFQWHKLVHEIAHYHNRNHKTLRKSHNGLRPKFAVTKKGTKPFSIRRRQNAHLRCQLMRLPFSGQLGHARV